MKGLWKQILGREAHPVIQFVKYGVAGGIATAVDIGLFYYLALQVFPALLPDDELVVALGRLYEWAGEGLFTLPDEGWLYRLFHPRVVEITEAIRERNFLVNRCLVFVASNFTAYVLNVLWVFRPGRHNRRTEITLFYLVSISSFLIGTGLGWALISFFGLSTTQAYAANLVSAVLINYFCRKYLVFHG